MATPPVSRLQRKLLWAIVGTVLAWLLLYAIFVDRVAHVRADVHQRAVANLSELSLAYMQSTERLIGRIDVLQEMGVLYTRALWRGSTDVEVATIKEFLDRSRDISDVIALVTGVDASGIVLWSTAGPVTQRIDLSDREHFLAIARDGKDNFIGRPVLGRVSGRRTIQFTRAVKLDGRLIGAIVVSVDVDLAARKHAPQSSAANETVLSLLRRDGAELGSTGAPGRLLPLSPDVLDSVRLHQKFNGQIAAADGQERLVALRSVAGGEAFVLVDRASEGTSADLSSYEVRQFGLFLIVAAVAVAGLALQSAYMLHNFAFRQAARRDREAVLASLAQLDEVARNLPDLVVMGRIIDGELRTIDYVSSTVHLFLAVDTETFRSNPALLCHAPTHDHEFRAALAQLTLTGEFGPHEMQIQRADGSSLWVEVRGRRLHDSAEPVGALRVLLVMRDISRRVEAREKVAESTRLIGDLMKMQHGWLLELTVRLSPSGLRILDSTHMFGVTTLLGIAQEEAGGRRLGMVLQSHANVRQMLTKVRQVALGSRMSFEQTLRSIKDEREIVVEWHLSLVERRGDIARVIGFAVDVTEAVTLRNQLAHASKLAFLGELAPSIAHELNQPLAAIALRAETLSLRIGEDSPDHAMVVKYVDSIVGLTQRAADVIRNIRSFARRDAPSAVDFELRRSVEAALSVMEGRLRQGGVIVRFDGPPEPILVRGQEMQIEQTIMNLLANSVDAYETMQPPVLDPEIVLSARTSGDRVIIEVADRAGGIPAHIRQKVFQPFFTTKPAGKGSGLGLSIVERIIKQMNGTISCDSHDGGTTFAITLPLAQSSR